MQEYKPLISVIIPIFNAQKYLAKCLKSVLNQTYTNLEILCIEDCSADRSMQIAKRFAGKDSRIKIFKNPSNLGAGLSRNVGIDNSNGKYILFLDSDDWLDKNAIQTMVEYTKNEEIDFINFGIKQYEPLGLIVINKTKFPQKYTNNVFTFKQNPDSINYLDFKITKFVNAEFLKKNNIRFNNNLSLEDIEYTLNLVSHANNVLFVNDTIYNYRTLLKDSVSSRIHVFVDYHTEYLRFAEEYFNNNSETKKFVLNNLYKIFIESTVKSFFYKKISYEKLRLLIKENTDFEILNKLSTNYYIDICNHIEKDTEHVFKKTYYYKYFIKKHFPLFFLLYLNFKHHFLNKNI